MLGLCVRAGLIQTNLFLAVVNNSQRFVFMCGFGSGGGVAFGVVRRCGLFDRGRWAGELRNGSFGAVFS